MGLLFKGVKISYRESVGFWGHMAGHYFTTLNYVYRNIINNLQDYFLVANLNIQHTSWLHYFWWSIPPSIASPDRGRSTTCFCQHSALFLGAKSCPFVPVLPPFH